MPSSEVEPESRRFALGRRTLQPRTPRRRRIGAVRSSACRRRRGRPHLRELLVGDLQRGALERDLRAEFRPASPATPPAKLVQPRLPVGEPLLGRRVRLLEVSAPLVEHPQARVASRAEVLERKPLRGASHERAGELLRRVTQLEVASVRLPLVGVADEVEPGFRTSSGARDVAPLTERPRVSKEDEGLLESRSLGGMAGEGIAVVEVLGRIGGRE